MGMRTLYFLLLLLLTGCATLNPGNDVQSDTEAAQINLKLGIGYMQAQRFDIAIEKLEKALEYDSSLAEAENALGVLYEATKVGHLADKHYQNALQLQPDYLLAQMNYARFLCANGQSDRGEALFLQAATSSQQEAPEVAYTGAGVCARLGGALSRAEQHLQQALATNPFAATVLYELAVIRKEQGRYQEASDYLDDFHKRAGFNTASLELAVNIADGLGNDAMREQYASMLRDRSNITQQ